MKPSSLSTLNAHFHAFEIDGKHFLVGFVIHPNPGLVSTFTRAPSIPDIDGGSTSAAPFFYFETKSISPVPPGDLIIPIVKYVAPTIRFDGSGKNTVYVQDGQAIHPVPIEKVE